MSRARCGTLPRTVDAIKFGVASSKVGPFGRVIDARPSLGPKEPSEGALDSANENRVECLGASIVGKVFRANGTDFSSQREMSANFYNHHIQGRSIESTRFRDGE